MFLKKDVHRVYDEEDMITEVVSDKLLSKLSPYLTSVCTNEEYMQYLDHKVSCNLIINNSLVYGKQEICNTFGADFKELEKMSLDLRVPNGYLYLDDIITENMRSLVIPPTIKHIQREELRHSEIKFHIKSIVFEVTDKPAYTRITYDKGGVDWFCKEKLFAYYADLETLVLPDYVPSIAAGFCFGCASLKNFHFPLNISDISNSAFKDCVSLTLVDLSGCVFLHTISLAAFDQCCSVEEVKLPKGLCVIGSYAFSNCSALRKVVLPSSVRNIGELAFFDCSSIKGTFVLPQTLVALGASAIVGTSIDSLVMSVDLFFNKICDLIKGAESACMELCKLISIYFLPKSLKGLVLKELSSADRFEMIKSNFSLISEDTCTEVIQKCKQAALFDALLAVCPMLKSITVPVKYASIFETVTGRVVNIKKKGSSAIISF